MAEGKWEECVCEEGNRDLEIATCMVNCWGSSLPLQTWFLNHGSFLRFKGALLVKAGSCISK
jgi:hypothetical protein